MSYRVVNLHWDWVINSKFSDLSSAEIECDLSSAEIECGGWEDGAESLHIIVFEVTFRSNYIGTKWEIGKGYFKEIDSSLKVDVINHIEF